MDFLKELEGILEPLAEPKVFVLIEGMQGSGKTYLACTFPKPIFLFDTENRADLVIKRFTDVYKVPVSSFNDIREKLFAIDQKTNQVGTLVFDSASELQPWAESEWCEESKKDRVFPIVLWHKVWQKIDKIIGYLRERGRFNVVFTARLKDEYINDGKTGTKIADVYKKLPYKVDFHLRLDFDDGKRICRVLKDGLGNTPPSPEKYLQNISYEGIVKEYIEKEE